MALTRTEIQRLIELEADLQGIDPAMALAVAQQESGFDPMARSPKGALGVMQLMPKTAQMLGVNREDIGENIEGGVKYLAQLSQRYDGDRARTLAAYNAGPGMVDAYKGVPPFKETRGYVAKIMGMLSPASAEAASGLSPADAARLQELEAAIAREEHPGAPASTPDEASGTIAQMRQRQSEPPSGAFPWGGGTRGVSTPEEATASVARMRQRVASGQADRLPSDMTIDIEKPSPTGPRKSRPWWDVMSEGMEAATPGRLPTEPTTEQWGAMTPQEDAATRAQMAEHAKQGAAMGISTLGSMGGAAGGAAIMGPPGAVLGETGGSVAARWLNVQLGLEEPGTVGDVVAVAGPGLMRGVGAAVKRTVSALPGTGVLKHERAAEALAQLPQRLGPLLPSAGLYEAANAVNPPIPTVSLWRQAGHVIKAEQALGPHTRNRQAMGVARDLHTLAKKHGGQVPLQQLDAYRQRVSQLRQHAAAANAPQAGKLSQLHSAIMDDMERAGSTGVPGGKELVQAIRADRKEHALATLADLRSEGKGIQFEHGDITHVYGKRIQNQFHKRLTDDAQFAKSWTPEEVRDIKATLAHVATIAPRPPTSSSGTMAEGVKWAGRLAGVGTGGMAGVGMFVAGELAPKIIAGVMASRGGRAALRLALSEGQGRLSNAALRSLADLALREQGGAAPTSTP